MSQSQDRRVRTDEEAAVDGIDKKETVREGLIELRNNMLKINRWDETLLLSHAIWWLSEPEMPES